MNTQEHPAVKGRSDLWRVDPKKIEIDPDYNIREDYGDMAEFTESIRLKGVMVPLEIRRIGTKFILISGHRRHRAALAAKLSEVPCVMEKRGTTDAERSLNILLHNGDKPLTILEQARAIHRQVHIFGDKPNDIADCTGLSRTHVNNCLALFESPPEIHTHVKSGKISASLVIKMITETQGDHDALKQQVETAIHNAEEDGKDKATQKHVPGGKTKSIAPGTQRTDWNQVSSNPDPGTGGSGPGEPKLSRDAEKNLEKFNKMLEKINPDKCIPGGFPLAESIYNFFDGKSDLKAVRKLLLP